MPQPLDRPRTTEHLGVVSDRSVEAKKGIALALQIVIHRTYPMQGTGFLLLFPTREDGELPCFVAVSGVERLQNLSQHNFKRGPLDSDRRLTFDPIVDYRHDVNFSLKEGFDNDRLLRVFELKNSSLLTTQRNCKR